MDEQNNTQPKPGDVIKPGTQPAEMAPAPAPAVTEVVAPQQPVPAPIEPVEPKVEETPPTVPPPVGPTPTPAPTPSHKMSPIFAIVLFVVLLVVGALLYFLYFRGSQAPTPAPIETNETTESTMPGRTMEEDTTSLQYLRSVFGGLDSSTEELTNDTEIGNQLNLGTPTSNNSEL